MKSSAMRLSSLIVVVATLSLGCSEPSPNPLLDKPIKEVRIVVGGDGGYLELRLADPDEIRDLVEVPIRQAKLNPNPARYVLPAVMHLTYDDGSKRGVYMFLPWGHFKRGEEYFTTDFSGLEKKAEQLLHYARIELGFTEP